MSGSRELGCQLRKHTSYENRLMVTSNQCPFNNTFFIKVDDLSKLAQE